MRHRDSLPEARAAQSFPLPQRLEDCVRLVRDPVQREMIDHLLEDGRFLSGFQLGNKERGAEV